MPNCSIILVDTNMLNSEELLEYLSESENNNIVLPDYIAIEAYKNGKLESIAASVETISKYPQQVMILHGTRFVTKQKDYAEILKWKFINRDHTREFSNFCHALYQAQNGNIEARNYILEQAKSIDEFIKSLLKRGSELADSFKDIEKNLFKDSEVKIIRKSLQLLLK